MQEENPTCSENFPTRLKCLRKERKLTLEGLAGLVGSPVSTVHGWEKHGREPADKAVRKRLAEALGVSEVFLFYGVPGPSESEKPRFKSARLEEAPMVYPAPPYAPEPSQPTEEDCRRYFDAYLKAMRRVPGGMGHTMVQLRLHFPLQRAVELGEKEENK